jgi:hypothetical protein
VLTAQAQEDLRLFDFLVERSRDSSDFAIAERALEAIKNGLGVSRFRFPTARSAMFRRSHARRNNTLRSCTAIQGS